MSFRIAVVEDDDLIRDMIALHLSKKGYDIQGFPSAETFIEKPEGGPKFDLLILDILLPKASGDTLLTELREMGDTTPAIMLTAKSDMPTRLMSFSQGADDFLAKPFDLDELRARIEAVMRRSSGQRRVPSGKILVINRHRVDTATRLCESNHGRLRLSEKEIMLLSFLTEHAHETMTRADILEEVWGMDVAPTPRTVDNFILKFRKLFEDSPEAPRHFLSIRGQGYRFDN